MENKKKSKSKILIMLFAIVLLVVGASFAIWNYSYSGTENNVLSSPDLSFRFLESNSEVISIDNGVPMKDEDGIKQSDTGNVFDFEVKSKASMDTDVSYDINLEKLSVDSGKTALSDSDIKVYIEDFEGNTVLKPTKVSDLSDYKLVTKVHRHSKSNSEISTKYKLKVWLDESVDVFSLEGKQYKFKIGVSTNQKEQDKNQTYSLVYNLDGGTGSITDSTFKVGDKVTISSTVPVKDGYKFLGWSTKKNASSASYKAGDNVTLDNVYDGKVTLYAVWQGKTYTVKYDSNGGTGNMDDSVFKLATDVRLSSNKFSKENYTFIGWSTSKGGEVTYTNEAKVKDLGGEGDVVTLYAVWKGDTYTVKYDSNGGNGFIGESSYNYGNSIKLTKNKFTKDGYTFIGWNTNKDASVALYTDEQEVSGLSGNITLYAVWKVNEYNVNVTVQNGTVDVANKKVIEKQNGVFNLTPSDSNYKNASVSCTNNQTGIVKDNVLTVSNVTKDTVCTVTYYSLSTILYNDGTLILNEMSTDRSKNTTKHGSVTKEYAPMDESNSYVFSSESDRPWNGESSSVTSVEIGSKMSPTSTAYWFDGLANMEKCNLENLDTSNATTMANMFAETSRNVQSFALSGLESWNTSKVTDMNGMFVLAGGNATTWNIGDISNWDVSGVTNMSSMFFGAAENAKDYHLGSISNWDVSNVTNMSYMFGNFASNVTTFRLDLSNWNTSKVTNMSSMFDQTSHNATTWSIGDLSNWDVSNVTNMSGMFAKAGYDTTTWNIGDISKWDVSKVTDMSSMFAVAGYSATTWSIGDISKWDVSNVTNMSYMFDSAGQNATTWSIGHLSNWDVSKVTNMSSMFSEAGYDATTWSIGDLSNWDVSNVTNMYSMFGSAGYSATTWNIGDISKWDVSKVTDMRYMFSHTGYNSTIFDLNLSDWNVSSVTNMYSMFGSAGENATKWIVKIPKKTGSLNNSVSKWYGSSDSVYAEPASGRQFTLPVDVNVVVQDGSLASGETSSKSGWTGDSFTFGVVPNDSSLSGFVSCTNGQSGSVKNNILTIKNVTSDTTCTVTFASLSTVLYNDGTLILNELSTNRDSNISTHGSVTKEYDPMDENNSYVFSSASDSPWNDDVASITRVEIGSNMSPTSTAFWFFNLLYATTADFAYLDVSNVIDMNSMFKTFGFHAKSVELDLSSWNTSKVVDMSNMFSYAGNNTETFILKLSNWNVSNVTDMSSMFDCAGSNATTWIVGVSNWDVSKVTNMSNMFNNAGANSTTWTIGDLSKWDVSKVTNMSGMFDVAGYSAVTWSVKIPKNTGSLSNATDKFYGASDSVYASPPVGKSFTLPVDVNVVVQDGSLASGEVSIKSGWTGDSFSFNVVPNDSSLSGIVTCTNGQSGSVSNNVLTVSNVTSDTTCTVKFGSTTGSGTLSTVLFNDGTLIINEYSSNRDTNISTHGAVVNEYEAYSNSNAYVFGWNGAQPWNSASSSIKSVEVDQVIQPVSMDYWFGGLSNLENGEFSHIDTSEVTSMKSLFENYWNQTSNYVLNGLDTWDTSKVTDMTNMFSNAGMNATTWSVKIPKNTGSLSNTTDKFYGASDSVYASPPSGKNFTLAS